MRDVRVTDKECVVGRIDDLRIGESRAFADFKRITSSNYGHFTSTSVVCRGAVPAQGPDIAISVPLLIYKKLPSDTKKKKKRIRLC